MRKHCKKCKGTHLKGHAHFQVDGAEAYKKAKRSVKHKTISAPAPSEPVTENDKKLSTRHLKDRVKFDARHEKDHEKNKKKTNKLLKKGKITKKQAKASNKWDTDHAKGHRQDRIEAQKKLASRK